METQDLYETWRRRIEAEGRNEGRDEGVIEGRIGALFKVLGARGVEVNVEQAERIRACRDLAQLDAWLERAASAQRCADVLTERDPESRSVI